MMKYNSINEIVKGALNDTQHQNNTHLKTSPIDCDEDAADQCTMWHGTYIHIMI